jgi:2-haloacid dehalogenase
MTIRAVVFDAYGTLYDIQSVAGITDRAYPGYGDLITQIWRIKQLEYTWLRSLMRRYEDFSVITRESLGYTLDCLGLARDAELLASIMDKYVHLDLYPDALPALSALKDRKLAILSNGSTGMLNALVRNTGLDQVLDATISIDAKQQFKPSPAAYTLIESTLGIAPADVLFVSSNPFDVCGAKSFGCGWRGSSGSRRTRWHARLNDPIWSRRWRCSRRSAPRWTNWGSSPTIASARWRNYRDWWRRSDPFSGLSVCDYSGLILRVCETMQTSS